MMCLNGTKIYLYIMSDLLNGKGVSVAVQDVLISIILSYQMPAWF